MTNVAASIEFMNYVYKLPYTLIVIKCARCAPLEISWADKNLSAHEGRYKTRKTIVPALSIGYGVTAGC